MPAVKAAGRVQSKFNVKRQSDRQVFMNMMVNNKRSRGKSHFWCPLPPFSIDDCHAGVPAAGYRNGSSLNNAGDNGNYWSSIPNESDARNAYNLNFNSSDHNLNWNNRNNGQSVRPVSELTTSSVITDARRFSITKDKLLVDIVRAYHDARKHKRGRGYQLDFEFNLEDRLVSLRDDLFNGTYIPLPSTCFIVHEPKMREVFAADFRDRIVHHLFYNYTHVLFERTFIYDTYSCIKGRGIHFGIERLKHHIRSVSAGYSKPCYILKLDIKSYFMNIDKHRLLKICRDTLGKMRHRISDVDGKTWESVLDYSFLDYLLESIIFADPVKDCILLGDVHDWEKLPKEKSLFFTHPCKGLPIGNLTSQLFSNIYMNVFDQYVKRGLGCRHYGRYVDDAYIVSDSRSMLKSVIPKIKAFLDSELGLCLNPDKLKIFDANHGVEFLGAYIKPFRTYMSSSSLRRIRAKILSMGNGGCDNVSLRSSVNSYLGVFSHCDSYCMRRVLFGYSSSLAVKGHFSRDWLRFIPYF